MITRESFLKRILAGLSLVPVVAQSATFDEVVGSGIWKEKHWVSDGIKFSEYILPRTMNALFHEDYEGRPLHRKIVIPMFNRDIVDGPFDELVSSLIDSSKRVYDRVKRMPVSPQSGEWEIASNLVGEYNPKDELVEIGSKVEKTWDHVTIVKVDGYPSLMGLCVTDHALVPVRDFYRDIAIRSELGIHSMGMKNDIKKIVTERDGTEHIYR